MRASPGNRATANPESVTITAAKKGELPAGSGSGRGGRRWASNVLTKLPAASTIKLHENSGSNNAGPLRGPHWRGGGAEGGPLASGLLRTAAGRSGGASESTV